MHSVLCYCLSMSETVDPQPDYLSLSPALEERLIALPQDLTSEDTRSLLDQTLSATFDPNRSYAMAEYLGSTPEAIAAVQEGLVHSLEVVAADGRTASTPREIVFPVREYFKEPDALIVATMQERTDKLKSYFMLDELQAALQAADGGSRSIRSGFDVADSPDYSWVEVTADDHSISGLRYGFYKTKPDDPRALSDAEYSVRLHYLGSNDAPVSEDYPYYAGMSVTSGHGKGSSYIEETNFEIPEDMEPLLGPIAKKLITEELVRQLEGGIEIDERTRNLYNKIAKTAVSTIDDPQELRDALERLGIYDDPESFRK